MTTIGASYTNQETGEYREIYADDLEGLSFELPEDYNGGEIAVYKDNDELMGWLLGHGDWRYA